MTESRDPFGWIEELTGENFLAVYDVVLDIRQQLQFSADVVVSILPAVVKFEVLMPTDTINLRDRYCEFRWMATELLRQKGVITSSHLLEGNHRWEGRIRIQVNQNGFERVVTGMDKEYERRSNPPKPEDKSSVVAPVPAAVDPIELVRKLIDRFHTVVIQLRSRHDSRPTLDVNDEYDVQDLLHALLKLYFDDVRPE